ncbi:hypothetical protein ABZV15_23815 [Streptomyces sp. NPDC005246]|uniref:hypothetical protein n=1 Tax=Streptomyces sp. NPDC005246 TaxID=3156716 RepID=UPI0033A363FA
MPGRGGWQDGDAGSDGTDTHLFQAAFDAGAGVQVDGVGEVVPFFAAEAFGAQPEDGRWYSASNTRAADHIRKCRVSAFVSGRHSCSAACCRTSSISSSNGESSDSCRTAGPSLAALRACLDVSPSPSFRATIFTASGCIPRPNSARICGSLTTPDSPSTRAARPQYANRTAYRMPEPAAGDEDTTPGV